MKSYGLIIILAAAVPLGLFAQEQSDTISSKDDSVKELKEVVVEARLQSTSAKGSVYIPTSKQKNSSQTATELINRMAIPQLSLGMGSTV